MKAFLIDLQAVDAPDGDPRQFHPIDQDSFGISITLAINSDGTAETCDLFEMIVCTPSWLYQRVLDNGGFELGKNYLFVNHYDVDRLHAYLRELVGSVTGESWKDIALQIDRFAHWEFA